MTYKPALIVLLAAGISGALALAESKVSAPDTQFMKKAGEGGLAEVKLGELAKDKGSSQAVKDFGDHMVKDHSKLNDEFKSLASRKGVTLSDSLNAKDQ